MLYQLLENNKISLNLNVYAIFTRELIVSLILNDYSLNEKLNPSIDDCVDLS